MLALEIFDWPISVAYVSNKRKELERIRREASKDIIRKRASSLETFQKLYLLELIIDSGNFYVDFLLSQRREGIHFGL